MGVNFYHLAKVFKVISPLRVSLCLKKKKRKNLLPGRGGVPTVMSDTVFTIVAILVSIYWHLFMTAEHLRTNPAGFLYSLVFEMLR